MQIWKHPLKIEQMQTIQIPQGATVLCVQAQNGLPCVWFKCDPDNDLMPRRILTFVTGEECEGKGAGHYIGTYQLGGGSFVAHVFECAWDI